jgi:TolB protein
MRAFAALIPILIGLLPASAAAVLEIDIRSGVAQPLPVAVVPFAWEGEGEQPGRPTEVVRADLQRSGLFRVLDPADFLDQPHRPDEVRHKDWRLIGADALVIGRMLPGGEDRIEVRFRLYDVYRQQQVAGVRYSIRRGGLRGLGHRIADRIHERLIGYSGAFSTQLAYVVQGEKHGYRLRVADADGANAHTILNSQRPVMSPVWSPDGKRLAYVSFETRRPAIYVQELATGERQRVAAYSGLNSAPAFGPKGRRLALTLSRDGNPEIYILDLESQQLRRVTRNGAIDTEPTWSPDGDSLIFTSDRAGGPQLYRKELGGGPAQRLTFSGRYNAAADWSPDGERVTFVHGDGSSFAIAVLDLTGEEITMRTLTGMGPNESPSFAPNGHTIVYATQQGGQGQLATVSVDGAVQRTLRSASGDVREPAWSPDSD